MHFQAGTWPVEDSAACRTISSPNGTSSQVFVPANAVQILLFGTEKAESTGKCAIVTEVMRVPRSSTRT